jgi:hypothetical protein
MEELMGFGEFLKIMSKGLNEHSRGSVRVDKEIHELYETYREDLKDEKDAEKIRDIYFRGLLTGTTLGPEGRDILR